jgi:glutathione peroxidase
MTTSTFALVALCLLPLACSSNTESKSNMDTPSKPASPAASQPTPKAAPEAAMQPAPKAATMTASQPAPKAAPKGTGFYALSADDIDGKPQPLSQYQGKVALVVNVASKCGFTPQYTELEKLYTDLAPRGFVILAFPSNDFGGQEPGTPEEIKSFCSSKYSVTFPLFEKVVT